MTQEIINYQQDIIFNKLQRERLKELSYLLTGSTSAWEKIRKDPEMQVPIGTKKVKVYHKFAQIGQTRNYRLERLQSPEEEEVVETRPMTFEELEAAIVAALEMKNFAELYKEGEDTFYSELVKRYRENILINQPFLIVSEDEKEKVNEMIDKLPEDYKTFLKDRLVPNKHPKMFCVDSIKFLDELLAQLEK